MKRSLIAAFLLLVSFSGAAETTTPLDIPLASVLQAYRNAQGRLVHQSQRTGTG